MIQILYDRRKRLIIVIVALALALVIVIVFVILLAVITIIKLGTWAEGGVNMKLRIENHQRWIGMN